MSKQNIPTPKNVQEEWLNTVLKDTRYCHFFTVSIADKTPSIGNRPSQTSKYFYTVGEAKQHKAELEQQHPNNDYVMASGLTHVDGLVGDFSRWALLHKQRIELLTGGEA
ncbi:hypothetical protein [Acinetobacter boissieri]|uniref:Uncharacterized protein n=1 Tax=Acinetobacter boissieri TaxID=1219383 RepID=A0A1G6HG01_9GAMM|nr:hypothetical protein [Acinetobacter boissieri]SDB92366.1 hypothetical protein SAMN05421733_10567 [Acinetobacter boissieri]